MASGKTYYLITGPNRGIGKGFVSLLLQRPSTTIIAGVRDPSSEVSQALTTLPKADGSKLILVKIDSAAETDPAAAVAELQTKHGITSLDVVISNAGIASSAVRVSDITADSALEHFRINAVAPLVLFKAVAPLLKASGGNPIFVGMSSLFGSIYAQENLARVGMPPVMGAYGASKAALNWLVNRLKFEEPWLTSFVFHPGLVETDMSSALATIVDTKAMGAISVEESVNGMVAVIDGATRELSGKFKKYDGSDLPW